MTWNVLLTKANFELAWNRIRNSPITTTKDRLGLKVFSQSLDVHIENLIQDIKTENYEPLSPSILYLPKKSGRLRPFALLHMRDRLVYQAMGNLLISNSYEYLKQHADVKVFSPVLAGIDSSYVFYPSFRKGDQFEGQFLKFSKKQTELISSAEFSWKVQADIASFYPSIDHSLLVQKVSDNYWLDTQTCNLLQKCLRVWSSQNPHYQVNKGLPIGYETSDLLASLFLNDLDRLFENHEYLRYVDDLRIYTRTEEEGKKILNDLDMLLQKHGLVLQEAKSKIERLDDFSLEDQFEKLKEQQLLLSSIDRDINSPDQTTQEKADVMLRKLLKETLVS
jgi:retron-type reverse transcriptase